MAVAELPDHRSNDKPDTYPLYEAGRFFAGDGDFYPEAGLIGCFHWSGTSRSGSTDLFFSCS